MADPTVGSRHDDVRGPYTERLAKLVTWLFWIALAAGAAVIVRGELTNRWPLQVPVDRETGTASIAVTTDAGTGCQYLLTPWGGIMPRTGADGRQVCAAKGAAR